MVIDSGYAGEVYPVNPGYRSILGRACCPDLAALPQSADRVVIALGSDRLEAALDAAIAPGALAVDALVSLRR